MKYVYNEGTRRRTLLKRPAPVNELYSQYTNFLNSIPMKNLIILSLFLLPLVAVAQNTEGQIFYTETIKLEIELPPEVAEQMKGQLPTEQVNEKVLYFNSTTSLFKDVDDSDKDPTTIEHAVEDESGGGMRIKMMVMQPDNRVYKEFASAKKVEQRDFMGKKFLIKDKLLEYNWKMTGEQKKIGDYACMQAVHQDEEQKIEAWFTTQIPVSVGPGNLGQLPGAILEANFDDGQRTYAMTSVNLKTIEADVIVAPEKGKEVTEEEMEKIIEEKTKEMEEDGGGRVMRIRRN